MNSWRICCSCLPSTAMPDPLPAPFARYCADVRHEWIDYNGHLHDASYAIVLSEANEVLLAALGLSEDYQARTGRAMYTVESHIRYLAETARDDRLAAASFLVSADPKRLRTHTVLTRRDGTVVATGEHLYLHVDNELGRVIPMPADRWDVVAVTLAAHAALARPEYLGRGIAGNG
jgi:acyl-CoA thioesterase FadM